MPGKRMPAHETRTRLVEAALHTLREHSLAGLTLETVAREAGMSKGGLLHHFPSKDVLVEAILHHLLENFEVRVESQLARDTEGPGRLLRAYVRATFDGTPLSLELLSLLASTLAENPRLMSLVSEDFARWQVRLLDDGVPPARAMVIRHAADAYWSTMHVATTEADEALWLQVRGDLLRLIEEAVR